MAKVSIQELLSGDQADAADANATLTSWNTNSTNIDDDNFRIEGLDWRSFQRTFQIVGSSIEATALSGDMQTIASIVTLELTTPLHVGGFTVASDRVLVVRMSVDVKVQTGGASRTLRVYIGRKSGSGGAATFIPETLRRLTSHNGFDEYVPMTITHVYDNTSVSDLYLTLMASKDVAGGDDFVLRNGFITAIQYARSN